MRNLHNLDLLRTIAVTLVLIDHTSWAIGRHVFGAWDTAHVGVFGVYLFFVHTSLVLMWSLERQPHVLNFYIRRAFRIYPLAIGAILTALIFGVPVWAGGSGWLPVHFTGSTVVSNLLLVQDLVARPNIVGVLWTLTIEVQMYLVLPALFFLAARERKIWQLIVLWALAVAANHANLPGGGVVLPKVIPDFIPGVIAYLAFEKFRPVFPAWTFAPWLLALLAIYMVHPGPALSWPIALGLGLSLPLFRQISTPAFISASHTVAKYSFGIYLWHSFGIKLAFHFLPGGTAVKVVGELVFTAVASAVGYHLVEEPMIRFGNRLARANERREASVVMAA